VARLKKIDDSSVWLVPAQCLVGRSRACNMRLTEPKVSGEHALLRWRSGVWELQDLHSHNGTHVDGRLLGSGRRVVLEEGTTVGFGRPDEYVLFDAGPPPSPTRSASSRPTPRSRRSTGC
jgi:predicted component of type VI protein secretion system